MKTQWKLAIILTLCFSFESAFAACQTEGAKQAYKISKMHCESCEESLVSYFSKLPNVANVSASYKEGCLKIEWLKGKEPLKTAEMASAIQKLGFEYK